MNKIIMCCNQTENFREKYALPSEDRAASGWRTACVVNRWATCRHSFSLSIDSVSSDSFLNRSCVSSAIHRLSVLVASAVSRRCCYDTENPTFVNRLPTDVNLGHNACRPQVMR